MPIENTSNQIANQYGKVKEIEDMVAGAPIQKPRQVPTTLTQNAEQEEYALPNGEPTIVPGSIPDARERMTPDEYNEVAGIAPWLMLLQSNPTPEIEDLGRELLEVKRAEYGYQIPGLGGVADNGSAQTGAGETTGENRISGADQQAASAQKAQPGTETGGASTGNQAAGTSENG